MEAKGSDPYVTQLTESDYRYIQRQLGLRYKVPLTDDEINDILREWDYSFMADYAAEKRAYMRRMDQFADMIVETITKVFGVGPQELGVTYDRFTPGYGTVDPQEPGHPDSDLLPVPYRPR